MGNIWQDFVNDDTSMASAELEFKKFINMGSEIIFEFLKDESLGIKSKLLTSIEVITRVVNDEISKACDKYIDMPEVHNYHFHQQLDVLTRLQSQQLDALRPQAQIKLQQEQQHDPQCPHHPQHQQQQ